MMKKVKGKSEKVKMKKVLFFLYLILLTSWGVFGETGGADRISADKIGLEQVRTLALANSRSLAKYNLAIQNSLLDERSRLYSNLPSLSLGASASIGLWDARTASPVNPFETFSSGANFRVSQKVFEGGKTLIQKAINQIATESARKDALAEYFNVLDTADSAYYAVLEAVAALEADEASLQTAEATLAIAEIRQASGMINRGDYLKALADKEGRVNSRNQSRRNLTLNITKLKAIIGLNEIPALEPIDFDGYEQLILRLGNITDEDADSIYEELWKLLAASNPSLAKASLANQRAEKNLSMAKRNYSPSLSASFSTGFNFAPEERAGWSGGSISLSASIPIDVWVIANNVEKSKLARNSAALDYTSTESNLETELYTALINALAQAGSILSSRRSLDYAEKHFEFVMERYRLSQSSMTELGDASSLLITSRNNLIRAQYGFLRSLSKLRSMEAIDNEERLTGILLGE